MKKTSILFSCIVALVAFALWASPAFAFPTWSDPSTGTGNCSGCHGDFRAGGYVSSTADDGVPWSDFLGNQDDLMNGHQAAYPGIDGDCEECHGPQRSPVYLNPANDPRGDAGGLGCVGCHGRDEDGADGQIGDGLRARHAAAGVTICAGCHPVDSVQAGEDVPPATFALLGIDPCDENGAAAGTGNIGDVGLDNDGDGLRDSADPDCEPTGPVCGNGVPETGEECDDGDANGTTICGCQNDCTLPAMGTSCADGEFCNGDETCDGNGNCQAGMNPCAPGDTCDEVNDVCVACTTDADCDDGRFCNGAETCDANGTCQPGTNPCTANQTCDEVNDVCISGCTDDAQCDDGVGCTVDTCDVGTGVCSNTPDDANCPDDGLYCNGAEFCDPVADCSSTGDPCLPGETCDEDQDICVGEPVVTDLDIARFRVPKTVRLGREIKRLQLTVENPNGGGEEMVPATLIGMQNNMMIYNQTIMVFDLSGNGRARFAFPSAPEDFMMQPVAGTINWMVEIFDEDDDDDTATATTRVR